VTRPELKGRDAAIYAAGCAEGLRRYADLIEAARRISDYYYPNNEPRLDTEEGRRWAALREALAAAPREEE